MDTNPIKYSDLIAPDSSITDLIKQLQDLISEYEKAKSAIQGSAKQMAEGLQGVSGATEEQRKQIAITTEEVEKLAKSYKEVSDAERVAYREKQAALQVEKEQQQVDKLIVQASTAKEGSYNKLSAQYRLNKIALNQMSAEERKATEAGKKLEKETAAMYEEMKKLQEATGKHQLSVGDYGIATQGLKSRIRELIDEMAQMKMAGQDNTEEYRKLAEEAGKYQDVMNDVRNQTKNMASDTRGLDSIMGATSAARGGLGAMTSAMVLLGANTDKASKAQRVLSTVIGIVSGATAVANALQKDSALMIGLRTLYTKIFVKTKKQETTATTLNTKAVVKETAANEANAEAMVAETAATQSATVATNGFKKALISTGIGAILVLIGTLIAHLDELTSSLESTGKKAKETFDELEKDAERIKKLLGTVQEYYKSLGKSEELISRKTLDDLFTQAEYYKNIVDSYTDKIDEDYTKARDKFYETLDEINKVSLSMVGNLEKIAAADVEAMNTKGWSEHEKEIRKTNKAYDDLLLTLQKLGPGELGGRGLIEETKYWELFTALWKAKSNALLILNEEEAKRKAASLLDINRSAEDNRLVLIQDSYDRERKITQRSTQRAIEDIRVRLNTDKNLTAEERAALQSQIYSIQAAGNKKLADLDRQYRLAELAEIRKTEDARIALMVDGEEKQREMLRVQYERKVEDLKNALTDEYKYTAAQREEMNAQILLIQEQYLKESAKLESTIRQKQLQKDIDAYNLQIAALKENAAERLDLQVEIWELQRQLEIERNAQLAEDLRQDEADINAKWDAYILRESAKAARTRAEKLLEIQADYEASEFDLLDTNSRQKEIFSLEQERKRLQAILDLDKEYGGTLTEQERQTIENTIAAIDKEAKKKPYDNLYELLGLGVDDEQQTALNTAIDSVKDSVSSLVDSWKSAADAAVDAAQKQVDATKSVLDAQIAAREAGYANQVTMAQKEYDLALKQQQKAQKEKERAQKAQLIADSIEQSSSLVTATANIWKALSGISVIGPALAITAIGTMWGSFLASKVKAAQVTKETYGEGTVELLQGGSHASGHDIDLGTKPDGTRRRAEGGEFFAVINKRNSRRYRSVIPDVINSLNDGSFGERYMKATEAMSGLAVQMAGPDVSGLAKDVSAIREQGDERRYIDADGNEVIKYKNLTRKIYKP